MHTPLYEHHWIPTLDLYETLASWDIKIGQGIGLPSGTWVDYSNTWGTSWHLRAHSTFLAIPLGAAFFSFLLLTEAQTDLPRSELALQCITTRRKWCINSSCKLIDRCATANRLRLSALIPLCDLPRCRANIEITHLARQRDFPSRLIPPAATSMAKVATL